MTRGRVRIVRGHKLRTTGRSGAVPVRDGAGRGLCECDWTSEPGLTVFSLRQAHAEHKRAVLAETP